MLGELIRELLASGLGLGPSLCLDALNFHLHPVGDPGDVQVGATSELIGALRSSHPQPLDGLVDRALQARDARGALALGNLAHGAHELGEQHVVLVRHRRLEGLGTRNRSGRTTRGRRRLLLGGIRGAGRLVRRGAGSLLGPGRLRVVLEIVFV